MAEYSHMWFQMGNTMSSNDIPPPPINTLLALTSLNKNSMKYLLYFTQVKDFKTEEIQIRLVLKVITSLLINQKFATMQ